MQQWDCFQTKWLLSSGPNGDLLQVEAAQQNFLVHTIGKHFQRRRSGQTVSGQASPRPTTAI